MQTFAHHLMSKRGGQPVLLRLATLLLILMYTASCACNSRQKVSASDNNDSSQNETVGGSGFGVGFGSEYLCSRNWSQVDQLGLFSTSTPEVTGMVTF